MKKIVSFFYAIGLLFGGVGLIYSIAMLIVLNGVGDVFEMKEPEQLEVKIHRDSLEVNIYYTYNEGGVENSEYYKINVKYFDRYKIDTIVVKYNASYPMISFIEGVPLKQREQKIGIFISASNCNESAIQQIILFLKSQPSQHDLRPQPLPPYPIQHRQ
jgi:hypothetical protein